MTNGRGPSSSNTCERDGNKAGEGGVERGILNEGGEGVWEGEKERVKRGEGVWEGERERVKREGVCESACREVSVFQSVTRFVA